MVTCRTKAAFQELQKVQNTLRAKLEPYFQVHLSTHLHHSSYIFFPASSMQTQNCFLTWQQLRHAGPVEAAMPPKWEATTLVFGAPHKIHHFINKIKTGDVSFDPCLLVVSLILSAVCLSSCFSVSTLRQSKVPGLPSYLSNVYLCPVIKVSFFTITRY